MNFHRTQSSFVSSSAYIGWPSAPVVSDNKASHTKNLVILFCGQMIVLLYVGLEKCLGVYLASGRCTQLSGACYYFRHHHLYDYHTISHEEYKHP